MLLCRCDVMTESSVKAVFKQTSLVAEGKITVWRRREQQLADYLFIYYENRTIVHIKTNKKQWVKSNVQKAQNFRVV